MSFERLKHTQSFVNSVGVAEHYFNTTNYVGEDLGYNIIPGLVEGRKTIDFEIVEAGGDETQSWTHLIHDYRILSSRRKGRRLVLRTVDMKATYNIVELNRAHRVSAFASQPPTGAGLVDAIILEGALKPDTDLWEACPVIPEFEVLRQTNLTNYQFLTRHVLPRMKGGYYLYTNDGKKAQFHTAGYKAEKLEFDPLQIHDVEEHNKVFDTLKMGGSTFEVTGYDPMLKSFLGPTAATGGVSPSFGNTGPMHKGNRREATFLQQDQSLDWWSETRNRWHSYRSYSLNVIFRGFIPDSGWVGSMRIEMEGTKFREPDKQQGFVCAVLHEIEAGKYEVTAMCNRDKID